MYRDRYESWTINARTEQPLYSGRPRCNYIYYIAHQVQGLALRVPPTISPEDKL